MAVLSSDPNVGLHVEGSRAYTWLVTAVAALGAVMFGFDIAIISGAGPYVQAQYRLSDLQFGWGVSSLLFGCMVGSSGAGFAADRFGRKRTLLWIALVFAFTSVATALAPSFFWIVVARIVGGVAVGAASMICPLYIAEISPSGARGRMVAFSQLGITFGILVSYYINYVLRNVGTNNWRWMFASGGIPSVAFFCLLFVVPESPRWLYRHGRSTEALRILTRIAGAASAERECKLMGGQASRQNAPWGELFKLRYRRVLIIGLALAVLVQASGINTVISYAPIILRTTGDRMDSAIFQTFVIGTVNFLCTFVAIAWADRVGRRPLYIAGSAGMTVSLILLSIAFLTGHMQGYIALVLILIYIMSFSSCIGPVFWILMAEIFPGRIRSAAMSLAVLTQWISNFVVVLFFPFLLRRLGGAVTFAAIAVLAALMLLCSIWLVPETRGKSLEEIEQAWPETPLLVE